MKLFKYYITDSVTFLPGTLICLSVALLVAIRNDVLVDPAQPRSLDGSSTAGLEHFPSGTLVLEACRTTWLWCWSDATALAGYAIMTTMMSVPLTYVCP